MKPQVTRKKPSFWEDNFQGVKRAIALQQLHLPLALSTQKVESNSWCRLGLRVHQSHSGSCVSWFSFLASILLGRRRKVSKVAMAKHSKINEKRACHSGCSKTNVNFQLFLIC
jgi:hypothetical protein